VPPLLIHSSSLLVYYCQPIDEDSVPTSPVFVTRLEDNSSEGTCMHQIFTLILVCAYLLLYT
jgi:hypothetical protein